MRREVGIFAWRSLWVSWSTRLAQGSFNSWISLSDDIKLRLFNISPGLPLSVPEHVLVSSLSSKSLWWMAFNLDVWNSLRHSGAHTSALFSFREQYVSVNVLLKPNSCLRAVFCKGPAWLHSSNRSCLSASNESYQVLRCSRTFLLSAQCWLHKDVRRWRLNRHGLHFKVSPKPIRSGGRWVS